MRGVEVFGSIRHRLQRSRGQALVEFGLAAIVLALILSGTIEFGIIFGHKVEINNAARAGARWAADNSMTGNGSSVCTAPCWSSSANPLANTVEGQIRNAGGTSSLSNTDSHISITYTDAAGTTCGHYSASSSSFAYNSGYVAATCPARGGFVTVTVTNSYPLFTNLFAVAPALSSSVTFEVMN